MSYNSDISEEIFNPANFPKAINELSALCKAASPAPVYFKVEIVVSYLTTHSLQSKWVDANPALVKIVTSGVLKTMSLESLFDTHHTNKPFLKDVESFISKQLLLQQ